MRTNLIIASLAALGWLANLNPAFAQSTAFTYQGRLNDGANLAHGNYEILFRPFGVFTGGSPLTFPRIIPVAVGNGLFTTTLDFGPAIFDGSLVYLQLEVRTNGAAGYNILTPRQPFTATPYAIYAANETSWSTISDRNATKNLQPVDAVAVLDKLSSIPLTQWNYKWEADTNTPHLGPMAPDSKAAFYPGRDDKSISTLEFDGAALAAIQGLNQKLSEELKQKATEITELKQRLEALEKLITNPNSKGN